MTNDTIPARLIDIAKRLPHAPAYARRVDGIWRSVPWADYAEDVVRTGRALIALGVEPGAITAVLGFNRPEWTIFDLATMGVGGAPAGIYTTSSPTEVAYVLNHAEAPLLLVENEMQWRKVEPMLERLTHLRFVITMMGMAPIAHEKVLSWEAFLARGDTIDPTRYHERVAALEPDALATLIYTSGTTGPPKAVMLSHRNLAWTAREAAKIFAINPSDSMLSYLPLSHIAEQVFSIHIPVTTGATVYFATSIDEIAANLQEVQPTIVFGVPRIWEKFHAGISAKLSRAEGLKGKLASWAMQVGREEHRRRLLGGAPNRSIAFRLANKLVYSKVKRAIGLGNARCCVSGAAPVAREVLEFMTGLDVLIYEVYGQSEDTGPTSLNVPGRVRLGSVGPAFPGVEVRIADDGEILVRGPNVFLGYRGDEEATAQTLVDGWLCSGDLGEIRGGFLYITGRKKDLLITAGGKNIAPQNIELALKQHPLIAEAVLVGDRRKYLVALMTLDEDNAASWAQEQGLDLRGRGLAALSNHPKLYELLQGHVDGVNRELARVEQVKRFAVLDRNLSIEAGELTPSLKVKRNKVYEHFATEIEALYVD